MHTERYNLLYIMIHLLSISYVNNLVRGFKRNLTFVEIILLVVGN